MASLKPEPRLLSRRIPISHEITPSAAEDLREARMPMISGGQ